jgi:hypothetical protein
VHQVSAERHSHQLSLSVSVSLSLKLLLRLGPGRVDQEEEMALMEETLRSPVGTPPRNPQKNCYCPDRLGKPRPWQRKLKHLIPQIQKSQNGEPLKQKIHTSRQNKETHQTGYPETSGNGESRNSKLPLTGDASSQEPGILENQSPENVQR